jgi:hypothetical protein
MERATRGETLSFGSSQRARGPPWPSSSTATASVDDADEEAAQMRAAIAASLGEAVAAYATAPAGGAASSNGAQWSYAGAEDDDAELRAAIAASLATTPFIESPSPSSAPPQPQQQQQEQVVPVPPQPDAGEQGVIQLAVRLPTGARFVRRFHSSTSLKVSLFSCTLGSCTAKADRYTMAVGSTGGGPSRSAWYGHCIVLQ